MMKRNHLFYKLTVICFLLSGLASAEQMITHLQKNNYTSLSSHADMMVYLQELVKKSDLVHMEIMGYSVEGRKLPVLFLSLDKAFGSRRGTKPLVLIFCQQHGDEPSGKEAALLLASQLIQEKKELLRKLDLILIPQMNPDGAEKDERRNGNEMDLNRNHAILSEPETRALHALFFKWMPEVTLDVHEYGAVSKIWVKNGFIKDADEQLGKLSNLNVSDQILDFSREIFLPTVGEQIKAAGFTFHEYMVGTPFENDRMRYSTTAVNDGRQSLGIYQTLSFILEGKQYGDVLTQIGRRTSGQLTAITAFLQTVSDHAPRVIQIVRESRAEILQNDYIENTRAAIQMDYYLDSSQTGVTFPVFDLLEWKAGERELKNFHRLVRIKKSVKKPLAYLIPPDNNELLEILSRHHIEINPLPQASVINVQGYRILHVTTTVEEELEIPYVDLEIFTLSREFPAGSMMIYLTQPAGILIPLLLEPQSSFSLYGERSGQKYRLEKYLKENTEFPIYRIMEPVNVHQIKGDHN